MNIVISGSPYTQRDLDLLFGEEQIILAQNVALPTLLKTLKIYKSSNQAIRAGRKGDIPTGYTELRASKKVTLYIWNPTE